MKRPWFVLALVLAVAACEGPIGPVGPGGPGTRIVFDGTTDSFGEAVVDLPTEAGTITDPPAITCYVSADGDNWLVLALDTDATTLYSACVLVQDPGNLIVVVIAPAADLLYRVVVIY